MTRASTCRGKIYLNNSRVPTKYTGVVNTPANMVLLAGLRGFFLTITPWDCFMIKKLTEMPEGPRRNSKCYCHSGKKWKNCHRLEETGFNPDGTWTPPQPVKLVKYMGSFITVVDSKKVAQEALRTVEMQDEKAATPLKKNTAKTTTKS